MRALLAIVLLGACARPAPSCAPERAPAPVIAPAPSHEYHACLTHYRVIASGNATTVAIVAARAFFARHDLNPTTDECERIDTHPAE